MKGVGLTLVQEELSAHIGGEVTAVVAAEGHHKAAQPGQSEVIIWSRDLVLTNHSSPRVPGVPGHGGHVPLQQGPLPLCQGPVVINSIS